MMIRLETNELEMVISIALKPASAYALRSIVSLRGKLDRQVAIDTLTAHFVAALRPYELMREPGPSEIGRGDFAAFPRRRRGNAKDPWIDPSNHSARALPPSIQP